MRTTADTHSQRLLRKGALPEETYSLFLDWRFEESLDANFDRVFAGRFSTQVWGEEVKTTLRRRFRDLDAVTPLVLFAKNSLPFEEWRSCLLLWIGIRDPFYREFALNWLYPEFDRGSYKVTAADVQPFVRSFWKELKNGTAPLTDYGVVRTARDLVRMAHDLGLLAGKGSRKQFAPAHLSDRCFLYYAHAIAEAENSTSRIPQSKLWRLALIRPEEVRDSLLRLHQFRKLEYEVAGSLVQLTLPCASSREFAERMVA
jgi:hypothetical protein